MDEFTVFIRVNIDSLKEISKFIPIILSKDVNTNNDIIKIKIVKKYLLISLKSKLMFENINLFIKIFFGLLKDKIWFNEYLNKEKIFINLKPELVEKKDPPIITKIKKINDKLLFSEEIEKPMLDILLDIDKKFSKNSLLKLKKRKKTELIIIK